MTEQNNGTIHVLYDLDTDPDKKYFPVLGPFAYSGNVRTAKQLIDKICKKPNEKIDLFGYSRGGATALFIADMLGAMVKAKKLQKDQVRFLGLIDPVSTDIGFLFGTHFFIANIETVPDIFKGRLWFGARVGGQMDQGILHVMILNWESGALILPFTFRHDHVDMGDPIKGWDVFESIYGFARGVGVPLRDLNSQPVRLGTPFIPLVNSPPPTLGTPQLGPGGPGFVGPPPRP